ncbi:hypothetical protein AN911_00475 [Mycobacteroides immunogenum]|uniref:HNH endonuclease n=1 Tax=Mycobacteroides immunogenum TaxID=83262 RepID=A0A7V8LQZ8_9MYCO|nr:hypothetical protein AN909_05460 [Mycobacteroides immunogenum]KPG14300.1 hypothetical protein AN908_06945 [Mycobacteroides immunogenum]KPG17425.1 hypothetical protein AN910_04685 [Mycobacteroides immunogenum]KPG23991.1 hypothetical protein AN911_00475 [Mycobacteroides immunogenum]KPG39032.1 hypothetical protein AN914_10030 [Mycobacteroides immunogenum]
MNEKECRRIVYERAEGLCERCTRGSQITMHHRLKRGQGGPWSPENIVAVCGSGVTGCHGWIENHPDLASTEGFHVRPWEDPAEIPVLWRGTGLVLLTNDGGFKPWNV